MKPLWTPTIAWIVAIVIAILLALAGPEPFGPAPADLLPHGSTAPR